MWLVGYDKCKLFHDVCWWTLLFATGVDLCNECCIICLTSTRHTHQTSCIVTYVNSHKNTEDDVNRCVCVCVVCVCVCVCVCACVCVCMHVWHVSCMSDEKSWVKWMNTLHEMLYQCIGDSLAGNLPQCSDSQLYYDADTPLPHIHNISLPLYIHTR